MRTDINTKLISDALFETEKDNQKIYKKVLPVQNEINMYIIDYNIDYIIDYIKKSQNIIESCIDFEIINDGDIIKINNILNNILTKDISYGNTPYWSIINKYGQNFHIDKIVFKLYNNEYHFHSILNGGYKQKYEKYKNKYLQLKNMQL